MVSGSKHKANDKQFEYADQHIWPFKTLPTVVLEAILDLLLLGIFVKEMARNSIIRFNNESLAIRRNSRLKN